MYPVQSSVLIEDGKHYIGHHYIVGDVYYAHVELISELEKKSAFGTGDTSDLAINDGVNKIKENS